MHGARTSSTRACRSRAKCGGNAAASVSTSATPTDTRSNSPRLACGRPTKPSDDVAGPQCLRATWQYCRNCRQYCHRLALRHRGPATHSVTVVRGRCPRDESFRGAVVRARRTRVARPPKRVCSLARVAPSDTPATADAYHDGRAGVRSASRWQYCRAVSAVLPGRAEDIGPSVTGAARAAPGLQSKRPGLVRHLAVPTAAFFPMSTVLNPASPQFMTKRLKPCFIRVFDVRGASPGSRTAP